MAPRTVIALSLACGLAAMPALAHPSLAAAYDNQGGQVEGPKPCVVGHRFEPGPIVESHHRQPTPGEFEARMRELQAPGGCSPRALSDRIESESALLLFEWSHFLTENRYPLFLKML
jgi:hypothetical protein